MFCRMYRGLVLLLCLGTVWGGVIDLGTIRREAERDILNIYVQSGDKQISTYAEHALALHGGFRMTAKDEAVFTFVLKAEGSGCSLEIRSGYPERAQFQKTFDGPLSVSTLEALDCCVEKTLGLPGFFTGKVVFSSKQSGFAELYVADLLFSSVKQLTHDRSDSIFPHWFPNGQKLIYTTYFHKGFPDLYTIDLRTRERRPFAAHQGSNTGGTPSPNGQNVAMILSATGNSELFVKNISAPQLRRLTKDSAVKASPSWSPDGTRLLFVSDRTGLPQIYEIQALRGPAKRIPTNISRHCTEPDWNPRDPNLFLFTAVVDNHFQIALYDFNTRQSRILTQANADSIEGSWINDGRHILFTRRTPAKRSLYVIDSVTGRESPLSPAEMKDAAQGHFHK
ncbi:MAG: hypothetical protein A2Y14_04540 [Verrucomicrobia bacterium GWF2_51_19]|nr:MAG: hypothetical protein A2Y14_04540 [Verrucomicrobia bacterium GWF2_51_19]HCJ12516.1 hypothetical protein [Opitutae bacterium]